MNTKKAVFFTVIIFFTSICIHAQERITIELNNGWKFSKGNTEKAFENNFNDSKW